MHSNWEELNSKKSSIEVLAKKAMELGYEYIGISDHTKDLHVEKGLNEKELLAQHEYIQKLNKKFLASGKKFRILHGCESNIRINGSIDIDDKVLSQLDYVIAGVHSNVKMEKKK